MIVLGYPVRMGWWLWNYDFESELWGKEVPNWLTVDYTLFMRRSFATFSFSLRGCFSRPATTISTIFPWFGFEGCIFDPLLLLSSLLIIFFYPLLVYIGCYFPFCHSAFCIFLFSIHYLSF
jgi:hypothetical protein